MPFSQLFLCSFIADELLLYCSVLEAIPALEALVHAVK